MAGFNRQYDLKTTKMKAAINHEYLISKGRKERKLN